MSQKGPAGEETEQYQDEEELDEPCKKGHLDELDEATKRFMSIFATIRGKLEDLTRAQSDIQRFELSLEAERKRLQKTLEGAKVALRNARIQMGAELEKLDPAGFAKAAALMKEVPNA